MRTIRKHEFTVPVWSVGIIENRLAKDHIAAYGKDGWLDVLHVYRFLRKNPVEKAGLTAYTDAGFRWKNDVSPLASDCMTLTAIEYIDDTENAEIVKGYGWSPETLKENCLSAARQIVLEHEDENGNIIFAVDPDCENDGRAEAAAIFLDSDQRTTEQLLSDFFGAEAENQEYIEEEIEEHADRMSDALRSLILPEIENQFPGLEWSVYVGFGEGIFGVFVQAEQ